MSVYAENIRKPSIQCHANVDNLIRNNTKSWEETNKKMKQKIWTMIYAKKNKRIHANSKAMKNKRKKWARQLQWERNEKQEKNEMKTNTSQATTQRENKEDTMARSN